MKIISLALCALCVVSFSISQELTWTSNNIASFSTSQENTIASIDDFLSIQSQNKLVYVGAIFDFTTYQLTPTKLIVSSIRQDDKTGEFREVNYEYEVRNLIQYNQLICFDLVDINPDWDVWNVIINLDYWGDDNPTNTIFYISNTTQNNKIVGLNMFNVKILNNTFQLLHLNK
jgi:hypothetical protein